MKNLLSTFCFLTFLLVNGAEAKETPIHQCITEAKKVCPKLGLGKDLGQCINAHHDKFTPACQSKMTNLKAQGLVAVVFCHNDFAKVCKNAQPGDSAFVACAKKNFKQFSDTCRSNLDPDLIEVLNTY